MSVTILVLVVDILFTIFSNFNVRMLVCTPINVIIKSWKKLLN